MLQTNCSELIYRIGKQDAVNKDTASLEETKYEIEYMLEQIEDAVKEGQKPKLEILGDHGGDEGYLRKIYDFAMKVHKGELTLEKAVKELDKYVCGGEE